MNPLGPHPWRALFLAPLAVPCAFAAALELSSPGREPVIGFVIIFAIGSIVSYVVTATLLVPSLFVASRAVPLTPMLTGGIGGVLGAVANLPMQWLAWRSSGPDSGPPVDTFSDYLLRSGWENAALPVAGLLTALLFHALARGRAKR